MPDLEQRADLLGSLLIGMTFSRYILADGHIGDDVTRGIDPHLATAIRAILFEPTEARDRLHVPNSSYRFRYRGLFHLSHG